MYRPQFRHYTEQELRDAVTSSRSLRQALIALGVSVKDNTYRSIKRKIEYLGIDTSHFTTSGPDWKRGRQTPLEDYFSGKVKITSHLLRCRLLEDGILQHKCRSCGRTTWKQQPIPLELNHINGDHSDNTFDNLELLCPNCHAQNPSLQGTRQETKA